MLLLDLIGLNLIIALIYYQARQLFPPQSEIEKYIFLIFNSSWFVLTFFIKPYSKSFNLKFSVNRSIKTYFYHFIINIGIMYILIDNKNPGLFYISYYYLAGFLFIPASKYISHFITKKLDQKIGLKKKVLIIGNGEYYEKILSYLKSEESGCQLINEIKAGLNKENDFSELINALQLARIRDVSEIYSTIIPANENEINKIIKIADNNFIRLKFIPIIEINSKNRIEVKNQINLPILNFAKDPLEDLENRIKKRLFDIILSSLVVFFILSWLWPILAILIKLDSKGSVLFKQIRNGRNNKPFVCLKFRTMVPNNESNKLQACKNDHRFTQIGKILRRTNLDELPQFFNVLRGEMSIVGPRPHMLKHTKDYSIVIDSYMKRHFIKPGISGWAQINGYRGNLDKVMMEKRLKYDLYYIQNWSPWLDLDIAIKTISLTIYGDKNAY